MPVPTPIWNFQKKKNYIFRTHKISTRSLKRYLNVKKEFCNNFYHHARIKILGESFRNNSGANVLCR